MKKYKTSVVEIEGADGVTVELVHDKDPDTRFLPMVAPPRYLARLVEDLGENGWQEDAVAYNKLADAGVPHIPLYESKAREAGLRWKVVG